MGRKPKADKATSELNDYGRRGTSQEKSVLMSLKDMVKTDGKVYYILWKYAPDLLPKNTLENPIKTFEDLTAAYECIKPDQCICENYLMEENVQKAVKWLRSRQHTQRMFDLYDKFCEKVSNGDVQAFKAVLEFGDKYLSDTKEAELLKVLHNVNLNSDDEKEDDCHSSSRGIKTVECLPMNTKNFQKCILRETGNILQKMNWTKKNNGYMKKAQHYKCLCGAE